MDGQISLYGTLVLVQGEGVLITGEAGIGKSEIALSLIRSGHKLVADDNVLVRRVEELVIGSCPPATYGFAELRGIGIIDVHEIFGQSAIKRHAHIDMIVHLEDWDDDKIYERIGDTENFEEILGKEVPYYDLPIRPGRNAATIIELIALHHRAKKSGAYAYKKLNAQIEESMLENERNQTSK